MKSNRSVNENILLNNSAKSQRLRMLKYLQRNGRLTVGEARNELGSMSPPARIMELRKMGFKIETHWLTEIDKLGGKHRNGVYIYAGEARNG